MKKLQKYRKRIDNLNSKIIKLLGKRKKITQKVGDYKKREKIKICDEYREKEIYSELKKQGKKYNLDGKFIEDIFSKIIKQSKKEQNGKKR